MTHLAFDSIGVPRQQLKGMSVPDVARSMLRLIARANQVDADIHVRSFSAMQSDSALPSDIEQEVREPGRG
jgi:hypothetical protein